MLASLSGRGLRETRKGRGYNIRKTGMGGAQEKTVFWGRSKEIFNTICGGDCLSKEKKRKNEDGF